MTANSTKQERNGTIFMSIASVFIAGMEWVNRPAPGEFTEPVPDWYATLTIVLHGAILALLILALVRVGRMTAETPGLRLPFTAMVLVGIAGAAYVVGLDFGIV